MDRLNELRQRAHDLRSEGQALLNAADAEDRDLTDEEEARYTALEADIEQVDAQIARAEQLADRKSVV